MILKVILICKFFNLFGHAMVREIIKITSKYLFLYFMMYKYLYEKEYTINILDL